MFYKVSKINNFYSINFNVQYSKDDPLKFRFYIIANYIWCVSDIKRVRDFL